MLYSIQNSYGKVYGIFPMPETTKSAEGLAHELKTELDDILGINGVRDSPLYTSRTGEKQDRVVIDIVPAYGQEEAHLARVHETVGRLAVIPQIET